MVRDGMVTVGDAKGMVWRLNGHDKGTVKNVASTVIDFKLIYHSEINPCISHAIKIYKVYKIVKIFISICFFLDYCDFVFLFFKTNFFSS